MNDTAAVTSLSFQVSPLFWLLASACVVAGFSIAGQHRGAWSKYTMPIIMVSLSGLASLAGAVAPALFFVTCAVYFLSVTLLQLGTVTENETLWTGLNPLLAFSICFTITILALSLIKGTSVWLYSSDPGSESSLLKMWGWLWGRYLIDGILLMLIVAVAWHGVRAVNRSEQA